MTDTKAADDNADPAKVDTAAPASTVADTGAQPAKKNTARVTKKSTSTSKRIPVLLLLRRRRRQQMKRTLHPETWYLQVMLLRDYPINDPNDSEFFISAGYGYTKAELEAIEAMRGESGSGGTNSSGSASPENLKTNDGR